MTYKCPVCFYPDMDSPAEDFNICSCCGTEFENDDLYDTHEQLRGKWIVAGTPWFFGKSPSMWNAKMQLSRASYSVQSIDLMASADFTHVSLNTGTTVMQASTGAHTRARIVYGSRTMLEGVSEWISGSLVPSKPLTPTRGEIETAKAEFALAG